jgi:hypothetical protein
MSSVLRRFAGAIAVSSPFCVRHVYQRAARSDPEVPVQQITEQKPIEIEDHDDEDDTAWVAKSQHCIFCRTFIASPCKIPFRKWDKCIAKAKAENLDMRDACINYTNGLMACERENMGVLLEIMQQQQQDNAEDTEVQHSPDVDTAKDVDDGTDTAQKSIEVAQTATAA